MCHSLGGKVEAGVKREFGHADLLIRTSTILQGLALTVTRSKRNDDDNPDRRACKDSGSQTERKRLYVFVFSCR